MAIAIFVERIWANIDVFYSFLGIGDGKDPNKPQETPTKKNILTDDDIAKIATIIQDSDDEDEQEIPAKKSRPSEDFQSKSEEIQSKSEEIQSKSEEIQSKSKTSEEFQPQSRTYEDYHDWNEESYFESRGGNYRHQFEPRGGNFRPRFEPRGGNFRPRFEPRRGNFRPRFEPRGFGNQPPRFERPPWQNQQNQQNQQNSDAWKEKNDLFCNPDDFDKEEDLFQRRDSNPGPSQTWNPSAKVVDYGHGSGNQSSSPSTTSGKTQSQFTE